jgi:hypothetical protein
MTFTNVPIFLTKFNIIDDLFIQLNENVLHLYGFNDHKKITVADSNPARDFELFRGRKLSSYFTERRLF